MAATKPGINSLCLFTSSCYCSREKRKFQTACAGLIKCHKLNGFFFFCHFFNLFPSSVQLNLVALNQPHTGNMIGIYNANHMCSEQARAMGLSQNYRAFVSSHGKDLVNVVDPRFRDTLPVTNLRVSLQRALHFFFLK